MPFCTGCGGPTPASARFCPRCGHEAHRPGAFAPPPGPLPSTSEQQVTVPPVPPTVAAASRPQSGAAPRRRGKALLIVLVLSLLMGAGSAAGTWWWNARATAPVAAAGADPVAVPEPTAEPDAERTAEPADKDDGPLTDEALVERFGPAVYQVLADGCGVESSGTAFAIDARHLVTNFHVVAVDTTPTLVDRSGERLNGEVIGWSRNPDVAVIRADDPLAVSLEWAETDDLREGQHLLALGYPVPDTDFSATPGSIVSFQSRSGRRQAIRTDAALDKGNSGGPALDAHGRVAGVVTEMADNSAGFQIVPLVFTHDALASSVEGAITRPERPDASCDDAGVFNPLPDDWEYEPWSDGGPNSYGDDGYLDDLWDACEAGDLEACDELYWESPLGSEYEWFGYTCGDRSSSSGYCASSSSSYPVDDHPGPWVVVLESLEVDRYSAAYAQEVAERYWDQGLDAGVLLSSDYSSLNPGYWVVYLGSWSTSAGAASECNSIKSLAPACYQRELSG